MKVLGALKFRNIKKDKLDIIDVKCVLIDYLVSVNGYKL